MEVFEITKGVILIFAIRWQLRVKDKIPFNKECIAFASKKFLDCFYFTILPSYT